MLYRIRSSQFRIHFETLQLFVQLPLASNLLHLALLWFLSPELDFRA